MWLSKKLFFSTLVFSVSQVLLIGCTLPDTQKRNDQSNSSSTFYVDNLKGDFFSETLMEEISIPDSRTYGMSICLKDLKHDKAVTEHPFRIKELNLEINTDSSGCFNWPEKIDFNYLTIPSFIKYTRTIESLGVHKGEVQIDFAINPWDKDNHRSIIDLKKNQMSNLIESEQVKPKLLGQLDKDKLDNEVFELWAEDGRLFVSDENWNPMTLKYQVSLQPYIKTKNTNGELSKYELKHGKFNGQLQIIRSTYSGDLKSLEYDILASKNFNNVKMDKGTLTLSESLVFPNTPNKGNIYLRINLTTTSPVTNLKNFSGIYLLGDYRQLKSSLPIKVINSIEIKNEIDKILPVDFKKTNQEISIESANKNSKVNDKSIQDVIDFNYFNIQPQNAENYNYHIGKYKYLVTTCGENIVTREKLAHQKFTIYEFSQDEAHPGKSKEVTSNKDGCLSWEESIEYDIYGCHHYKKGYVVIENKNLNLRKRQYYYVNPWDKFYAGFDVKLIEKESSLKNSCSTNDPKRSEVIIHSAVFKYAEPENAITDDKINNLLEWQKSRNYIITLQPEVKIPSHIIEGINYPAQHLIDGVYLVRIHITAKVQHSYQEKLIFSEDHLGFNHSGKIELPVSINFENVVNYGTRNTVYIQILPIKNHSDVQYDQNYNITLKKSNLNIESLIDTESSLVSPIYHEKFVLDTDVDGKSLRIYSGSKLAKNAGVSEQEMSSQKNLLNFEQLRNQKKVNDANKTKSLSEVSTATHFSKANNLDYLNYEKIKNLPLKGWINESLKNRKVIFNETAANQICKYWFDNVWKDKIDYAEYFFTMYCKYTVKNNPQLFFDIDHAYFIKNVASTKNMGSGLEKSININNTFSVSVSYNNFWGNQLALGAKLAGFPFKATKGVEKALARDFYSLGAELSYGMSVGAQTAFTESNSMGLTESTVLPVIEKQFKITANKYQFCFTIKPNQKLFTNSDRVWFMEIWNWKKGDYSFESYFKSNVTPEEKVNLMTKGLMFCDSQVYEDNLEFQESYYWVSQNLSKNEAQDPNDINNKKFALLLRGQQSYEQFKFFLSNKWSRPSRDDMSEFSIKDSFNDVLKLMSFKSQFPGVYLKKQ